MRKLYAVISAVFLVLLLTACTAEDEQGYYISNNAGYEEYYTPNHEDEKEYAEVLYTALQERFLQDLDYMLYVLENNFALFDAVYWARGVDIPALFDDMRTAIHDNPDMDKVDFTIAMIQSLSPLTTVAHFGIDLPPMHNIMINPDSLFRELFTQNTLERFTYPHVLEFYQQYLLRGRWSGEAQLRNEGLARRQIRLDRFILFGFAEEVHEINSLFEAGSFDEAISIMLRLQTFISGSPNVTTEILEEGSIAYLSINSFTFANDPSSAQWYSDKEKVHSFFEEIQDYEHLIIDLRRNEGGIPLFFSDVILRPIINEPVEVKGFVFAVEGNYSRERLNEVALGISFIPDFLGPYLVPTDNRLRSIPEMLNEFDLPELKLSDLERMDYGFPIYTALYPNHLERFGHRSAFNGKIWLLSSEIMTSASQISAWLSKESGFATHVGETTGGVMGGPRTAVALPNTGMIFRFDVFYVTDEHGRPFEAGTLPHHFNREGMDALETTLALIAEGEY